MYYKLAYRNVKKSYKDFLIYFVTLTFSVALFYVFNSFESQAVILEMDPQAGYMIDILARVMTVMSIIVATIFGFLILYANNFLIKRRKKELGMYTLFGMKKSKVNSVLIYETIFIGLASLVSGILLGILVSQVTATMSAKLIEVPVNFKFVFSFYSVLATTASFILIFLIAAIFNLVSLKRLRLIDLLKAERINDTIKVKNSVLIVLIFILSLSLLIGTYTWTLKDQNFLEHLWPIIIAGTIANFGLFYSFSAMIIKVPKLLSKFYYKNLNTFIFRQIGAKINSTYKMMSIISLMLLLGIGALATSSNLNSILSRDFIAKNPYDLTVGLSFSEENAGQDIAKEMNFESIRFESMDSVNLYHTGILLADLSDQIISKRPTEAMYLDLEVSIITLDGYNTLRETQGLAQNDLEDFEIIYFSSLALERMGNTSGYSDTNYQLNNELNLSGLKFNVKESEKHLFHKVSTMNSNNFDRFYIVMNETNLEKVKDEKIHNSEMIESVMFNFNFFEDQDINEQSKIIDATILNIENNFDLNSIDYMISWKEKAALDIKESTLLFTYIGLYLGIVFVISSAVVLSLQLVSEASDNEKRYKMLSKLGVTDAMARSAIFKQNLLYFGLPMIVALIHSWVGITAINNILSTGMMYSSNLKVILTTTFSVVFIYILYFLFTYKSSVSIIEGNEN